jgi:hypothetical protein
MNIESLVRILSFLVLISSSQVVTAQGGIVDSGGDLVECQPSPRNNLDGHYVLDYLTGLHTQARHYPGEGPSERIIRLLKEKAAPLGDSLELFLVTANRQIPGEPDFDQKHIWIPGDLSEIRDEELVESVPENCLIPGDRAVNLKQLVARRDRGDHILHRFDFVLMDKIKNNPLQMSFILVHEWLWEYAADAQAIRDVNNLLHSTDLDALTAGELQSRLRAYGLNQLGAGLVWDLIKRAQSYLGDARYKLERRGLPQSASPAFKTWWSGRRDRVLSDRGLNFISATDEWPNRIDRCYAGQHEAPVEYGFWVERCLDKIFTRQDAVQIVLKSWLMERDDLMSEFESLIRQTMNQ